MAEGGFPPFRRTEPVFFCLLLGPERKCPAGLRGQLTALRLWRKEEEKEGGKTKGGGREEKEQRRGGRKGKKKREGRARRGCPTSFPDPTYYRLSKELHYPHHGPCSSAWPTYKPFPGLCLLGRAGDLKTITPFIWFSHWSTLHPSFTLC